MPKKNTNYENTVIYKIQHIEKEDMLYVGSTTDFTKRKCAHKKCSFAPEHSQNYNLKLYTMIRENGGWDSFRMLEIEKFPCKDKREAEAEEDRIMKELKANMNSRGSYLDKKEYMKHYLKTYHELNREAIKLNRKEYRCKNEGYIKEKVQCQCGLFLTRNSMNLPRHKNSKRHNESKL